MRSSKNGIARSSYHKAGMAQTEFVSFLKTEVAKQDVGEVAVPPLRA
jgi:hypothetical protein